MYLVGVPLLLIPFAIYNIVAFLMPGVSWSAPLTFVQLSSGAEWTMSLGDIVLAFAILILLVEMVKFVRIGVRSWVDHTLAVLLFGAMTAEFILVKQAASATFFLLLVIGFVDVVGGFSVSLRARRRALVIERDAAALVPAAEPQPEVRTEPVLESPLPKPAPAPEPAPTVAGPPGTA